MIKSPNFIYYRNYTNTINFIKLKYKVTFCNILCIILYNI